MKFTNIYTNETCELRDYQQEIRDRIVNEDRSIIYSSCGSGKSLSTLTAITELDHGGVLVVAPLRVARMTWPLEIKKWSHTKHLRICDMSVATKVARTNKQKTRQAEMIRRWEEKDADIYIVNVEVLGKFCEKFMFKRKKSEIPVRTLVIDELTKMKSHKSTNATALFKVLGAFDRRVGLTGTLYGNGYMDLFNQVKMIDGGDALDHRVTYFQANYMYNPDKQGYKWIVRSKAHAQQIREAIAHLVLTIDAKDYGFDWDYVEHDEIVTLPTKVKKQYDELEKDFLVLLDKDEGSVIKMLEDMGRCIEANSQTTLVNKLVQFTGGTCYDEERNVIELHDVKIKRLKSLLKKNKTPTLVVTSYIHERDRILKEIDNAELFDEDRIGAWQKGKIPVWVVHYSSISHGVDGLQEGGNHIIWYSLCWSAETTHQLNKRLARSGQKEEITHSTRIMCENTIDTAIAQVLQNRSSEEKRLIEFYNALKVK